MSKKEKEILLNIMYTGTYLDTGNNIGHEVINLFKDDKGDNYIYVLPYGTMNSKHDGKIETILLVKRCNSKVMEILAKAEGLEQIKTSPEEQERHIKEVTYGGVTLPKIFEGNTENGNYVTFKAERVVKVSKPIFIATDGNLEDEKKNCFYLPSDINQPLQFPKQSPKTYISNINQNEAYNRLKKIIKDTENWKEKTKTVARYQSLMKAKYNTDKRNFISIIKQEYNELVFSNLFEYIFSSDLKGLNLFVQEVLGLKKVNFAEMTKIEREKENIDLLIYDENSVIVIENKIKSHINGICKSAEEDDKIDSQLSKYFTYVDNKENFPQENKYYFVIAPNYNQIDLYDYDKGDKYGLIPYSEIYNFFNNNKKLYKDKNVKYFDEFLYALSLHTSEVDNRNEEEMFERFFNIIQAKQKEKQNM